MLPTIYYFAYCHLIIVKTSLKIIKLHYYSYNVILNTISNDGHTCFHAPPKCSIQLTMLYPINRY